MSPTPTPPPPPPPDPERSRTADAFAWIAIGLTAAAFGLLYGLREWSTTRAAWDVIGGGSFAIAALVLAILAFRRRARATSRTLPITALVLAIVICVLSVGAVSNRRELSAEARACADRDTAWIDGVTPALTAYRRQVLRLDEIEMGQDAADRVRAIGPALRSLIALGEAADAHPPCDPRIEPYNAALITAGTLATEMRLAGEAVLAEPTSQPLVDRWNAASDRVAAAEKAIEEKGLDLAEVAQRESAG